jgi:hypothetical protein
MDLILEASPFAHCGVRWHLGRKRARLQSVLHRNRPLKAALRRLGWL